MQSNWCLKNRLHYTIAIAAHVDDAAGLFDKLKDRALLEAIAHSELDAFEWKGKGGEELRSKLNGTNQAYRRPGGALAIVNSSDAHDLSNIGVRFTWLKMGQSSMEGLRLALLDPELSVRPSSEASSDPNLHANCVIESLTVTRTKYIGNGGPFELGLNPWLNAIIGGRGTGKSSIVEFIRLVTRREDELPSTLRESFDKLARVPKSRGDLGLLRKDENGESELTLVYRRDGARFRLRWSVSGPTTVIEAESAPGQWVPSDGDVRERFPIRIFSQKQVFELAAAPGKLLEIIDDEPQVDAATRRAEMSRLQALYLQLRAQRRALTTRLASASKIRGELDDVLRKLSLFEQAGHSAILREFQRRVRQGDAVRKFRTEAAKQIQGLDKAAKAIAAPALDRTIFDSSADDQGLLGFVAKLEEALSHLGRDVADRTAQASQVYADWEQGLRELAWAKAVLDGRDAYGRLVLDLKSRGLEKPAEYEELVVRRQALEELLRQFDANRATAEALEGQAVSVCKEYLEERRKLSVGRRAFLAELQAKVPNVQLELVSYGARDRAEGGLRELLGAAETKYARDLGTFDPAEPEAGPNTVLGALYPEHGSLTEAEFEDRVAKTKDELLASAEGQAQSAGKFGVVFVRALQKLLPEQLDRLRLWWPEDQLLVSYRTSANDSFRRIDQGSPGQKTSALLAFFLAYGDEPLILDQPEDDLDNELIYDLLVQRLRDIKTRRQIIVVTHNPNVVVNGDAELVLPIALQAGRAIVSKSGTMQEHQVRDEICKVMEGGTDALKRRFRRLVEVRRG